MHLFAELKRRNVFKVGVAYVAVAWLLIQFSTLIESPLQLPGWFDTAVILLLAIGFPVALIIAWAFELTPEGVRPSSAADPAADNSRSGGGALNYLIIGVLSLAVVFLVIDDYVADRLEGPDASLSDRSIESEPPAPTPSAEAGAVLVNSIAILPFETLSSDADNADFAEGIYADIFLELEKLDRLTVIGRRTMKRYEDTLKSYSEIAAETNAQAVLELLVRFADNRVRINAELFRVDGTAESRIWAQEYQEEYTSANFFEIQTDVARNIAERLVGELSPNEEARLSEVLTENTEALAYYLRALPYIDDGTQENADNCLDPITQAVTLDPEFKEAWYHKGVCHDIRGAVYSNIAAEEQPLAVAAIERAIAIDDSYADALLYLSSSLASGNNWRAAGEAYRRALELEGRSPQENTGFLFAIGHVKTAFEGAQNAFDRDPEASNTIGTNFRMLLQESLGDSPGSDETYLLGRGLFETWGAGDHGRLVVLMGRARLGQIDRSVVQDYFLERYASFSPWHMALAETFSDRDGVIAILRRALVEARDRPLNQLDMATHAAYVGEPELALELLRNAVSSFGPQLNFVWTPLFQEVRQTNEFQAYMREIGMVDVWRTLGWPDVCEPAEGDAFRCD